MLILVTNTAYSNCDGSETWTFCLVNNLKKLNHDVNLFINEKINKNGLLFKKTLENGIEIYDVNIPKKKYNLILANHTDTINKLLEYYNKNIIIQTCHGIYPELEQPVLELNHFVSVSKEIQEHLKIKNIDSTLIFNGIDCERYSCKNKINDKLQTVVSLVKDQYALKIINSVCNELNLNLIHSRNKFNVEDEINKGDLVITVGRGIYEGLSCGRNVISYDCRSYYTNIPMGHGLLTSIESIENGLKDNFTGRNEKKFLSKEQLKNEILKYDKKYGIIGREYILNNLNIKKNIIKYLSLINN